MRNIVAAFRRLTGVQAPSSAMAEPIISHGAERSVLQDPKAASLEPYVIAGRKRLATCSGVAWFRGYHLAVVNLYGNHLRVYRFHPGAEVGDRPPRLELLHEMTEGLSYPEDVAVSPDGRLLAIAHSLSNDFGISLHAIDAVSLAPATGEMIRRGRAFHSVNFSPDSQYLAFAEVATPGYVEIMRVASPSRERTCLLQSRDAPLMPKAVAFSRDGRFVAIGKSQMLQAFSLANGTGAELAGLLSIHRFDPANGVIAERAVAELRGADISLGNIETCTFLPSEPGRRHRILLSNQHANVITAFEFDAEAATLAFIGVFATGLSFPHGLDASADGKFVAVTNYGDDTLRIDRVRPW